MATVPPIKRAVHHLTAEKPRAKPVARITKAAAQPDAAAQRQEDCDPGVPGVLPEVPLVTYASPIADEPIGSVDELTPGGAFPVPVGVGFGGGGGDTDATPPGTGGPIPGAIPEPSIWLSMILGVGALGAGMRLRRRALPTRRGSHRAARRGIAGGALWSGSAAVEAGDMAATVAVKSAVASAAGKAMLCVCPAVVVAGSVMTVPPLRQAVHASTLPAESALPAAAPPIRVLRPCIETMTVPVASSAIDGFPTTIETLPVAFSTIAIPPVDSPLPTSSTT